MFFLSLKYILYYDIYFNGIYEDELYITVKLAEEETKYIVNRDCLVNFEKKLEMVGVGYRANMEGSNLNMALGYSHPVLIVPPAGITLAVEANTKITVSGTNKQAVGDVAAFIRSKRPPEVYKGKGVKYEGEYIRRKAGKAGKK